MLSRSISRTDAAPTPTATALRSTRRESRVRDSGVSRFESSTPAMARASEGMTTAHATTGPARGPRPTSSTPAMSGPTVSRSPRSIRLQRRVTRGLCGGPGLAGGRTHLALLDARRLARELAEVVELRAAHAAAANHGEVGDHRAVDRKDALDA